MARHRHTAYSAAVLFPGPNLGARIAVQWCATCGAIRFPPISDRWIVPRPGRGLARRMRAVGYSEPGIVPQEATA